MKTIKKIIIKHIQDNDNDLSWLGTFGNEKGEFGIDNPQFGDNRNSYPYFNANNVSDMTEAKQNYETIMKYDIGDLYSIGIKAEAEIYTQQDGNNFWLMNKINSGGLWGIEQGYKNDKEDIKEIEQEQLEDLKTTLKEFAFSDKEINEAPIEINEV